MTAGARKVLGAPLVRRLGSLLATAAAILPFAQGAFATPPGLTVTCHRMSALLCTVTIPVTPASNHQVVTVLLPAPVLGVTLRTNNRDPNAEGIDAHALPGHRKYVFTLAVSKHVSKGTQVVATFALQT